MISNVKKLINAQAQHLLKKKKSQKVWINSGRQLTPKTYTLKH